MKIGKGRIHDFKLYKKKPLKIGKNKTIKADKGYQGIQKIHEQSEIPIKKTKQKPKLTKEEKSYNRGHAKSRIIVEHFNRKLKIFRILSSKYRNRRKRFGLRVNLIASIINMLP